MEYEEAYMWQHGDRVEYSGCRAALEAAMDAGRDCRTCANYTPASDGCVSALRCVGGDRYKMTAPRQYWEARPVDPAPFYGLTWELTGPLLLRVRSNDGLGVLVEKRDEDRVQQGVVYADGAT